MHGWYSKKQAALGGVVRYKTPNGNTVDVSSVTKFKEHDNWDDMIYLGEVTEYVTRVSEGDLGCDDDDSPEELLRKVRIIMGKEPPIDKSKLN